MFDLNKLGDMTKLAGQARQMQERQERLQQEQIDLLKNVSAKLDAIIAILKDKNK